MSNPSNISRNIRSMYSNTPQLLGEETLLNELEKGGKRAMIGETRTWNGVKYTKQHDGWKRVTSDKQKTSSEVDSKEKRPTIKATDRKHLEQLIKEAIEEQGPEADLNHIDVSDITDMSYLFRPSEIGVDFNGKIDKWDTSKVTNMSGMFATSKNFNQPIGGWDTSKVKRMSSMFEGTKSFNQDLSGWDTGNVTDMLGMFYRAESFNQDLNNWDTSKVKDMDWIFRGATNFKQNNALWATEAIPKSHSSSTTTEIAGLKLSLTPPPSNTIQKQVADIPDKAVKLMNKFSKLYSGLKLSKDDLKKTAQLLVNYGISQEDLLTNKLDDSKEKNNFEDKYFEGSDGGSDWDDDAGEDGTGKLTMVDQRWEQWVVSEHSSNIAKKLGDDKLSYIIAPLVHYAMISNKQILPSKD